MAGAPRPARLALEDGTVYRGASYAAPGTACAEVVFHTAMAGYTEILTDPSYRGQCVAFTYPLIGNYGVRPEHFESGRFQAEAVIVREGTTSAGVAPDLEPALAAAGVVGIQAVDTRSLVRRLRGAGVLKGCVDSTGLPEAELVDRARALPAITGGDWVARVSASGEYDFDPGAADGGVPDPGAGTVAAPAARAAAPPADAPRVAVLDCGVKRSILRRLAACGVRVRVFPASTAPERLRAFRPDGVVLSNGPGDPVDVPHVVELARSLVGSVPVLGICLGHQVLARAAGLSTYKLRFGHHGGNHPVGEVGTNRVTITSQNHNYCVEWDASAEREWELTLLNLNDRTVEGFRHRELPVSAVQFHPEAAPGPHDAAHLIADFAGRIGGRSGAGAR